MICCTKIHKFLCGRLRQRRRGQKDQSRRGPSDNKPRGPKVQNGQRGQRNKTLTIRPTRPSTPISSVPVTWIFANASKCNNFWKNLKYMMWMTCLSSFVYLPLISLTIPSILQTRNARSCPHLSQVVSFWVDSCLVTRWSIGSHSYRLSSFIYFVFSNSLWNDGNECHSQLQTGRANEQVHTQNVVQLGLLHPCHK
jgi:hypothetical protein